MPLSQQLEHDVQNLLLKYLDGNRKKRRLLLDRAFPNTGLAGLKITGDDVEFAETLLREMSNYSPADGKNMFVKLLLAARDLVEPDFRQETQKLIDRIEAEARKPVDKEDDSKYPLVVQIYRWLRGSNQPIPAGGRLAIAVVSFVVATAFAIIMFSVSNYWQPGSNQTCGHPYFIECGLNGPDAPAKQDFIIVVSGFGFEPPVGTIRQDEQADMVSRTVSEVLAKNLTFEARVIGMDNAYFGYYPAAKIQMNRWITGTNADERAAAAGKLAAALNADIVVYGIVRSDGSQLVYAPELLVPDLQPNSADIKQFNDLDMLKQEIKLGTASATSIQTGD